MSIHKLGRFCWHGGRTSDTPMLRVGVASWLVWVDILYWSFTFEFGIPECDRTIWVRSWGVGP